ncbi:MAG: hypothetical protein LBU16_06240 [Treponema sp.]|jgi:hypothetical protein|nr:hypothetical protein [Treponema sp.]
MTAKAGSKFGRVMYKFIWGEGAEFGDCLFYSILTLCLLGLIWLFTFELLGISVYFCLIPWVVLVYLIWREYYRRNPERIPKWHKSRKTKGKA